MIRARAFAKINLSLRVTGVRRDGFHTLRTVFQSIALHDTLTFRAVKGPFRIACDDPACPVDESNLVWRAAERLWTLGRRTGPLRDTSVRIVKRIPLRAGLAGGSTDAAAAIRALTSLWRIRPTRARIRSIARELGADVPYFLEGGTALGTGRGDRLKPMRDALPAHVVVVVPPFGVSTREAFAWWDRDRGRQDRVNDLQPVVAAEHPEIDRIAEALRSQGARAAALSGSGSAVFGLFDRRSAATFAGRALAAHGRVFLTRTISRAEYGRLGEPAP